MILAKGKLYDSKEQDSILKNLEEEINRTRMTKTLSIEKVIAALHKLGQEIAKGSFKDTIARLDIEDIENYIEAVVLSLNRENIAYKIKTELGEDFFKPEETGPPLGQEKIAIQPMPLGTILHIAAGNVDGLPVYSVAEGLLTGNVNILKLPQADSGLSVEIIMKLIKIEPEISEFVYIFDTPSSDLVSIKKMAGISDGIVVWGGDTAVAAVRQFAPPGCKLIEWGHRLGFAYISGFENKDEEMRELAGHILSTKQLLCSSCQTIYIDTENLEDIYDFCKEFLPFMEAAAHKYPFSNIGASAETSLHKYNQNIENILSGNAKGNERVFQGGHCSLTACSDKELQLSSMFGNCLVKRLPQREIFSVLRKSKDYLQTAGLICTPEKRAGLSNLLARCGVVRIMRAGKMSASFSGEAHDGEYSLRRYVRIVNIQ